MNTYRLLASPDAFALPALAIAEADLCPFGGPEAFGMKTLGSLSKTGSPVPRAKIDADLNSELAVGLYRADVDGESGLLVRYAFSETA